MSKGKKGMAVLNCCSFKKENISLPQPAILLSKTGGLDM